MGLDFLRYSYSRIDLLHALKKDLARKIRNFFEKENIDNKKLKGEMRWEINRDNIGWVELWLDYKLNNN